MSVALCSYTQTDTGRKSANLSTSDTSVTTKHSENVTIDFDTLEKKEAIIRKAKKPQTTSSAKNSISDTATRRDSISQTDSVRNASSDTTKIFNTTAPKKTALSVLVKKPIDSIYLRLLNNPFLTKANPIYLIIDERERDYKDEVFYLLCGLLLFLSFIKLIFSKYFKNIFRLFFQPAFRQKQTREQLAQNNLPSLLLNLLFIFSAGTYITFLLRYYKHIDLDMWLLLLYTNVCLLALYLGKFIFLSFAGWVFDAKEAANPYIFAVYLINKIVGVVLIPFTLLLAFSVPAIINISVTVSLLVISILFIYRYLVSYPAVRKELNVSVLHFLFFICAFEIIPLLLIYKTLIIFLKNSH